MSAPTAGSPRAETECAHVVFRGGVGEPCERRPPSLLELGWGRGVWGPAKDGRPPEGNMPSTPAIIACEIWLGLLCWALARDFSRSSGSRHHLLEARLPEADSSPSPVSKLCISGQALLGQV